MRRHAVGDGGDGEAINPGCECAILFAAVWYARECRTFPATAKGSCSELMVAPVTQGWRFGQSPNPLRMTDFFNKIRRRSSSTWLHVITRRIRKDLVQSREQELRMLRRPRDIPRLSTAVAHLVAEKG